MNTEIIRRRRRQPARTIQQSIVKMLNRLRSQVLQMHSVLVTIHDELEEHGCDKVCEVMGVKDYATLKGLYKNMRAICVTFNPELKTPDFPKMEHDKNDNVSASGSTTTTDDHGKKVK